MYKKVIISSGREIGGLNAFANALAEGFWELGLEAEVLSTRKILTRYKDLRDKNILKIFSTSSIFLAPFSKQVICVAHGFPRPDAQGWLKTFLILFSYKIAEKFSIFVSVSNYVKNHLQACYNIKVNKVIYNPISNIFLSEQNIYKERKFITYIGRFIKVKKVDVFIPVLKNILNKYENYKVVLVGYGDELPKLENMIGDDNRFVIYKSLSHKDIINILRKTKVFFSGCETEALGITYIEALSQGCNVVMPYSGGGIEISYENIKKNIFPYINENNSLELETAFTDTLKYKNINISLKKYSPKFIASQYLKLINIKGKTI